MSTFNTTKSYSASSTFIPYAIASLRDSFVAEGFNIEQKATSYDKTVLVVTKGNLVKKIVGLKQGLEISFLSAGDTVKVEVKGTVLKDQSIATALTILVAWPVVIPQIIGLIQQSGLDDKAIGIIGTAYSSFTSEQPMFCTHCGGRITGNPETCPHCGARL